MKPNFSLHYNGKPFDASCLKDGIYAFENGITVTLAKTEYAAYDAVEWVLWFENSSSTDSGIFSDILDCDTCLSLSFPPIPASGFMPTAGDARVISMTGCIPGELYIENDEISAKEFGFRNEYLDKAAGKTKSFSNKDGRSSDGMMPFFDVTASGDGYIAAIGWSGDWKASFTKQEKGIQIKTGLKETRFYLKPGEKIRTSSILLMHYKQSEDKHNKFRRLIKNHFSHKSCTNAERESLMGFELWGGITSEEMKKRIRELKKHDIRFEDIWIDAGWYGNCQKCDETFSGDWSEHTGEWTTNPRVHPGGLLDVAETANNANMSLMLWLEAERAIDGTRITLEHPDWFLSIPNNKSKILNFGNKEAAAYILDLVSDYVERLGMSCYRQDSNAGLTEYFRLQDEENRRGMTEIKHIMGLYHFWDTLVERFPHLLIDNCASGGRRIDIEALKRTVLFFRSDYQCNFNANPEVLQAHNAGICCYLPYNGCTTKTKSDTYSVRSSYASSWGGAFYNAIFQTMDEGDFAWAKAVTDEYRSIRRYFSMDFYNHGSAVLDDTAWAIWQYHDPDTQSGMVMAFRRSASPFESVTIALKGFAAGKQYCFTNLDHKTSYIAKNEITLTLHEKRSCMILTYDIV